MPGGAEGSPRVIVGEATTAAKVRSKLGFTRCAFLFHICRSQRPRSTIRSGCSGYTCVPGAAANVGSATASMETARPGWPKSGGGPRNSGELPPSPRHARGRRSPSVRGGDNRGGGTGPIQGLIRGIDRPGTPGTPRGKTAAVAATFEEEAATPSNEAGEGSPLMSDLHTGEKTPT